MDNLIFASKKRLALAVYIDYLLFSACADVAAYLLAQPLGLPLWQEVTVFIIIELFLYQKLASPGQFLLSIQRLGTDTLLTLDRSLPFNQRFVVDPKIHEHENWLTVLLGIIFILEGAKEIVRWSSVTPPLPVFGMQTTPLTFGIVSILMGMLDIYLGYLLLKLRKTALWIGLGVVCATTVSIFMSWDQWDEIIREMVIRRRALQGIAVRPGEIEAMQSFFPEAFIVIAGLSALGLFLAKRRLHY